MKENESFTADILIKLKFSSFHQGKITLQKKFKVQNAQRIIICCQIYI